MTTTNNAQRDLDWLLNQLVDRAVGASKAIVLSADGLAIGKSESLATADAEHLAAVASAFQSLARGAGRQFGGGGVLQTVVEMENAYLFVTGAGNGACLAVLAEQDSDVGMIAYEMNMFIDQVKSYLETAPRTAADTPLA